MCAICHAILLCAILRARVQDEYVFYRVDTAPQCVERAGITAAAVELDARRVRVHVRCVCFVLCCFVLFVFVFVFCVCERARVCVWWVKFPHAFARLWVCVLARAPD